MKGTHMNNKIFSDKARVVLRVTSRTGKATDVESATRSRYVKTKQIINSLAIIVAAVISPVTLAAGHGGGGGVVGAGHFGGGGGHIGGFAGGVSRTVPAFHGGPLRTAPSFQGAYFTGRNVGGVNHASHFYYGNSGIPAVPTRRVTAPDNRPANRSLSGTASFGGQGDRAALPTKQSTRVLNPQAAATNRKPNRTGSNAGRNRMPNSPTPTAASRQSFVRHHASEHHNANNWHRGWDRRHAHFHNNRVFVFIDGFWWGLYPWDYYPYYSYGYPYDYSNSYPYGYYNGYPDSYYDYPSYDNQQPGYDSDQYSIGPTVSAVQSELAKRGYYRGAVDGVVGDETEAALAHYQQDNNLSVTRTLTAATLQSLGLPQSPG